jgi:hypothetical protein
LLKRQHKAVPMDRDDTVLSILKYLGPSSNKKRLERRSKIYFMDETWLNEWHTTWSGKQAFLSDLVSKERKKTGKGRRLIIAHTGTNSSFVDGESSVL